MNNSNHQNIAENEANSATGSDILPKSNVFSANPSENNEKTPVLAQNQEKSPVNTQKQAKNTANAQKQEKNTANTQKSEDFSPVSCKSGLNEDKTEENSANSKESSNNNGKSAGEGASNSENGGNDAENSAKTVNEPENSLNNTPTIEDFFTEANQEELKSQFPAVQIENLRNNRDFVALLNTIIQNPTLSRVYSCFNSIVSSTEEKSKEKLSHALASAETGVGSLSSKSPTEQAFFTKEQVLQMTQEEIKRNYNKIRQSQQLW